MSKLGDRLAALAFEGHKKRKRLEEFERASFPRNLKRAWDAAKEKFEHDAEFSGATDLEFVFSCNNHVHWFPDSKEEVLDALPEEVQEMRRDPDNRNYHVGISEHTQCAYKYTIRLCVEARAEELIAEADAESAKTGKPYW